MPRAVWLLIALALPLSAQQPKEPHYDGFTIYPVDASIPPDPEVEKVLAPYRAKLETTFGRVLCQSPGGLVRGRKGEASPLGYWMADLMRTAAAKATNLTVDATLLNSGGLRANIRPGPVTVGDVYEVMPFENELVVVQMTGADLIHAVKQGIERRGGEPVSNLKAVVSGTPEHPSCVVTFANGAAIVPTALYRVATSDYLAKSGDTMHALAGRKPTLTGLRLRDTVLQACEALGKAGRPLQGAEGNRYTLPEAFLEPLDQQKVKFP